MITVYCIETNNPYDVSMELFEKLLKKGVIKEMEGINSYFPKLVFNKKDLAQIITKSV